MLILVLLPLITLTYRDLQLNHCFATHSGVCVSVNDSSVPLSQLPPQCGYSLQTTWRDLSLMASYSACHVTLEVHISDTVLHHSSWLPSLGGLLRGDQTHALHLFCCCRNSSVTVYSFFFFFRKWLDSERTTFLWLLIIHTC